MNTSAKAKIEIELDAEEAQRQMQALRDALGQGGGGSIPGRAPPSRVPIAPPPGGGGFGLPGGVAGTLGLAALGVTLKDAIRDGMAPMKTLANDVSNAVRQGIDKMTGGKMGDTAVKSRAFEDAFERTREFGRETLGMASGAQLDSFFQMQMRLAMLREQGDRNAENRRQSWSPGLPSIGR